MLGLFPRDPKVFLLNQVFWLRIALLVKPSHTGILVQWYFLTFVPGYSCGTAADFHGIP